MYKFFFKRLFDIILAFLALVIFTPIMIPILIGLLLTGEHYIFYLQKRIGYNNRPFEIWKFATMLKNSPNLGTGSLTLRNDPRLMPMGSFLRKTKINEFPQIVNIFKGDMSLVGPRPQMEVNFLKFPSEVQKIIYKVRPGITGIGSIIFRDEEKWISQSNMDPHDFDKNYIAPYKGALELWYQEHLSFYTDFMIILLTVWTIISPENDLVHNVFKDLPERPDELK
jgi:lipopolysaccharide/colanic/teichoic acid biosynthesis glycosyltransferase